MVFDPFPILEKKNLILRKMSLNDSDDFFAMRSDARMHAYTDTVPDQNVAQTQAYIEKMLRGVEENRWIIWAIAHKTDHIVIGSIAIWNIDQEKNTAELSYGITPEYQGKGLMREALECVMEYGFRVLRLSALETYTEQDNQPSRKLLERFHFREVGQADDTAEDGSSIYHMIEYRLDRPAEEA